MQLTWINLFLRSSLYINVFYEHFSSSGSSDNVTNTFNMRTAEGHGKWEIRAIFEYEFYLETTTAETALFVSLVFG